MDFNHSDVFRSFQTQYPEAVKADGECAKSLIASGARVLFNPSIEVDGKSVRLDILRRAADGVGWDVLEIERADCSYSAQVERLREAAKLLQLSGMAIYSFIYLSQNPEARKDATAPLWIYENISRQVVGRPSSY